ncbi:MAG: cyclic nucleotide-binding domain-containing protein, partial [Methylococcales bacterium]|nr:cyclic nucleotide-binding domain-containing protein [Methylococcales bacterium]
MTKPKKSNLKKSIDTDEVAIFLSGIKIFQHLDYDVIVDIAGSMTNESFISGDLLIKRGVSGTKMYIVWAGDVLVEVGDDRRGVAKEISLRRGAVIGEISMLSGKKLTANVIAKSNVIALSLNRESFHKLIRQHESFANALSELMSTRLVEENGIREVGKYKITAKIGEGGMSIVYNAIDPELERDVAIKMLKHQ